MNLTTVVVTRLQLHTSERQCLWALTGNTGVTLTENNIVNMMNKSIFGKTITVYNNAYDNVGRKQLLSEFLFGHPLSTQAAIAMRHRQWSL